MGELRLRVGSETRFTWAVGVAAVLGSSACWPTAPDATLITSGSDSASAGGGPHGAASGEPPLDLVLTEGGKASGGGGGVSGGSGLCYPPTLVEPGCVAAVEVESPGLCNGVDDDCDGSVDEGCPCKAGAVQPCFVGPPGRRGVGACADGAQTCEGHIEFAARWGFCTGGLPPSPEACDGLDNDCNGCADDLEGCAAKYTCPGPGDPRTPAGVPLSSYLLRGRDFFTGSARAWSWTIQGGPCDSVNPRSPSFGLLGESAETATFTPKLSGDYTVTLTVTPESGPTFKCSWIVHIQGPGLRIEMCYPESSTQDLDLYLKQPGRTTPWFTGQAQFSTALDQCSWANCEAILRSGDVVPPPPQPVTRADWGYPASPLSLCESDVQGAIWRGLGYCASPRLDIDNNLTEAIGVPENINVDAPRDNETFRIMVANFSGTQAHPLVNVYCDGRRMATIGAAPDQLPSFSGTRGNLGIGALWRAADVTTHVSDKVTTCTVNVLHPPGANTGFDVTVDDPRY